MKPSTNCPLEEDLLALAEGTLSSTRAEAVIDHAAICPPCFRGLAAARAVAAVGREEPPFNLLSGDLDRLRREVPADLRLPVRAFPRWFSIAAAAGVTLLVVGGGLTLLERRPGVPPTEGAFRGASSGIVLVFPAPNETLEAAPERLEWRTESPAGRYRVRLLLSVSEETWRAETSSPSLAVPAEVRERLGRGGRFFFEVARLDGGNFPSETEVAPFEVRSGR